MSFKEITALRKSGKLDDALTMAERELKDFPDDEWIKKAAAWVYYALMKKALESNNFQDIIRQIKKINALRLPQTERMVFDSIAWGIGKYLFHHSDVKEENLDEIFSLIKDFSFSRPADSYTFLLKAFNKHAARWGYFMDFVKWWGLDHFMPKDYETFITENGRKLPATAESIYISLSKKLLAEPVNKNAIEDFLPNIARIVQAQPKMQYPPYYYAKLLLALGDKKRFVKAFLPFARKKQRDFWVWDLMSEAYGQNSPEYFSCLCKSLSCGAPAKFTINVKEKLAVVLEQQNRLPEAKREYLDILNTRQKEGWYLHDKHLLWQNKAWWQEVDPSKNNFNLYHKNKQLAESLLYADKPEKLIVVDTVNQEKKVFSFVVSKSLHGFIHYGKFQINPQPGDCFSARFMEQPVENKSSFYKVYTLWETDKKPSSEILKIVSGTLSIKQENPFGFVHDVFVSPQIIFNENLTNGQVISIQALISYNKKKKSWGWKTIKVCNKTN